MTFNSGLVSPPSLPFTIPYSLTEMNIAMELSSLPCIYTIKLPLLLLNQERNHSNLTIGPNSMTSNRESLFFFELNDAVPNVVVSKSDDPRSTQNLASGMRVIQCKENCPRLPSGGECYLARSYVAFRDTLVVHMQDGAFLDASQTFGLSSNDNLIIVTMINTLVCKTGK